MENRLDISDVNPVAKHSLDTSEVDPTEEKLRVITAELAAQTIEAVGDGPRLSTVSTEGSVPFFDYDYIGNTKSIGGGMRLELDPESSIIACGGTRSPVVFSELHAAIYSKDAVFFVMSSRLDALTKERHYLLTRKALVYKESDETDIPHPEIIGVLERGSEVTLVDSRGYVSHSKGQVSLGVNGRVNISALGQQELDVATAQGATQETYGDVGVESIIRLLFKGFSGRTTEKHRITEVVIGTQPKSNDESSGVDFSQMPLQSWLPNSNTLRKIIET